jgi:hypothetical protein
MTRWKGFLWATITCLGSFVASLAMEAADLPYTAPPPHDERPFMVKWLPELVQVVLGGGIGKAYRDIATRVGLHASGYSDISTRLNLVA